MERVINYFKKLFDKCKDDSFVELRLLAAREGVPPLERPPVEHLRIKGGRFLFQKGVFINNINNIIKWARTQNEHGYHAFYGVVPRLADGQPAPAGCALWQDLDFKEEGWLLESSSRRRFIEALEILSREFGIEVGGDASNCYEIASSPRGLHLIFVLEKQLPRELLLRANELLAQALELAGLPVDKQVARDYARVLRMPGTKNLKYDDAPEVEILAEQKRPLDPKVILSLESKLKEQEEEEKELRVIAQLTEAPRASIDEARADKIAELIAPFWRRGYRHNLLLSLLGFFIKSGVSEEDATRVVEKILARVDDEEAKQRLYEVKYHYEKRLHEKDPRELLGLTGLRQVLAEQGVPEGKINQIIARLQEIINRYEIYNAFVTLKLSAPRAGVANVVSRRGIFSWKEVRDENDEVQRVLDRKLLGCALVRLKIIRNPYTQQKELEATFITEAGRTLRTRGSIHEIFARLYHENLLITENKGKEALHALLLEVERRGLAKVVEGVEVDGFYFDAAGYLRAKWDLPAESSEKVKRALEVLDEFVERFARQYKEKAATVIKNIVVAPFNFARKQLGHESWKWLILIGYGGTGKTTLAGLAGYLWNLPRAFEISAGSLSTEARVGRTLSRWTFPFVVNEVQEMFSKAANMQIRDLLKNAWSSLIVRGKYRAGEWVEELACASLLMTSNQDVELTTAEARRYKKIEFFSVERPSAEQKREFAEWKRNLEELKYLGYEIYKVFRDNPELLKLEEFEDAAERVLEKLYKEHLGRVPEWVKLRYSGEEDSDEAVRERLREDALQVLYEFINERGRQYLSRDELEVRAETPSAGVLARLKALTEKGFENAVLYDEEERAVLVRRQFLKVLKEKGIELATLEDLAKLLGGEVRKIKRTRLGLLGVQVAVLPLDSVFPKSVDEKLERLIFNTLALPVNFEEGHQLGTIEQIIEVIKEDKDGAERVLEEIAKALNTEQAWDAYKRYLDGEISALEAAMRMYEELLK